MNDTASPKPEEPDPSETPERAQASDTTTGSRSGEIEFGRLADDRSRDPADPSELARVTTQFRVRVRDPHVEDDTPVLRPRRNESIREHLPRCVGRYEIVGEIARGGIGVVLKARDEEVGRSVAVKMLLAEHRGNPGMVERFVEEAQINAQLQHPGVVPVHDVGASTDAPWFSMKLVKGRTLAALLESRRDPGDDRQRYVGIFEQICRTVAYAHARKVIHRDLKPANIIVGAFGEVQVMDWGLAKVLGTATSRETSAPSTNSVVATRRASGPGSSSFSSAGSIFGTPAYMPPEQARGELDRTDERSDVFSLGAILVEILTGKPAYTGSTTEEILRKARMGYLDEAYERLANCGADAALIDIARSALSFESRDRPRDASAIHRALSVYLTSLDERVRRAGRESAAAKARAREHLRVRRLVLILAVTVVSSLAIAASVFLVTQRAERERALEAEAELGERFALARERRAEATRLGPAALGAWEAALDAARRAAEAATRVAENRLRSEAASLPAAIEREVAEARSVALRSSRNRAMIARLDAIRAEWLDVETRSLFAYRRAFQDFEIDVEALDPLAVAARIRDSGIAVELAQALDDWAVWLRIDHGPRSVLSRRLFEIAAAADPDPLRNRLRRAIAAGDEEDLILLASRLPAEPLATTTATLLALGLRTFERHYYSAIVLRALELRDPANLVTIRLGKDLSSSMATLALYPTSVEARNRLAEHLDGIGELRQALAHGREAVRVDPESAVAHNILGVSLQRAGDVSAAAAAYARARALAPHIAAYSSNLGAAWLLLNRPGEAGVPIAQAIQLDPTIWQAWLNLGHLSTQGTESIAAFRESLRLGGPRLALTAAIGERLLHELQDLDGAAIAFRELLGLDRSHPGPRVRLGEILLRQGRIEDALVELSAALDVAPTDARVGSETLALLESIDAAPAHAEAIEGFVEHAVRLALRPNAIVRTRHLALCAIVHLARAGRAERAISIVEDSLGDRGPWDAACYFYVADLYLMIARPVDAIRALEDCAERFPDEDFVHDRLRALRSEQRPDLPTFGSIDHAIEAIDTDKLISEGAAWRLFRGVREPSTSLEWTLPDFDDTTWETGRSGFGYGDGDDATVLDDMRSRYSTIYVRHRFDVPDPSIYRSVALVVTIDDGFIAYLNGREIGRFNAGPPGRRAPSTALASSTIDATVAPPIEISSGLRAGSNVLAIQGINRQLDSTDLSLLPIVVAQLVPVGSAEDGISRYKEFIELASGSDAESRRAYIRGRILELGGKLDPAVEELRRAVELAPKPARPEPVTRLASCLRALGRFEEAEAVIRQHLIDRGEANAPVIDLWVELVLVDLRLDARAALARLSPLDTQRLAELPRVGDALWSLVELDRSGVLRINCGGREQLDSHGRLWGRDRFFGRKTHEAEVLAHSAADLDAPHHDSRAAAEVLTYRVPVPDGSYRITFHVCDPEPFPQRQSVFDVFIEGRPAFTWEIVRDSGEVVAGKRTVLARVEDGYLDIAAKKLALEPNFSALEIETLIGDPPTAAVDGGETAADATSAEAVGLVAEAQVLGGRIHDAVRTLEAASFLEDPASFDGLGDRHRRLLLECRGAIAPDLASFASIDAVFAEPERLVPEGALWRSSPGTPDDLSSDWMRTDDSVAAWPEGRTPMGFGPHERATDVGAALRGSAPPVSLRVRHDVEIADPSMYRRVTLSVRGDDGFIAYVNGNEVGRVRAGPAGSSGPPNGAAPRVALEPIYPVEFDVTAAIERGRNSIAIRVFNATDDAADLFIEAKLEAELVPGVERDRERFRAFFDLPLEGDRALLREYVEGRILERSARHDEAASVFENISRSLDALGRSDFEPKLALARCLRARGRGDDALSVLRDAMARARRARSDAADLALGELRDHGAIRIRCGGDTFLGHDGTIWAADRCFSSGTRAAFRFTKHVRNTADDDLYQRERWFDVLFEDFPHYLIPVPRGRYAVILHFAEMLPAKGVPGGRIFDVHIEGAKVLESFDIGARVGYAAAIVREFAVDVTDGEIELRFTRAGALDPKINAIAVLPIGDS
jgi:tetratricopeptide (TPR) repeat protein